MTFDMMQNSAESVCRVALVTYLLHRKRLNIKKGAGSRDRLQPELDSTGIENGWMISGMCFVSKMMERMLQI